MRGDASADRLREREGEEEGFIGIGRRSRVGQARKQRRDFGSGRIPMRRRQEEWRRSGGSLEIRDLSDLGRGWTIYIWKRRELDHPIKIRRLRIDRLGKSK